jgi:uncharacterized protein (TIGR00725 family)
MSNFAQRAGSNRSPQIAVLGSAEPGTAAFELAGAAGARMATLGLTVVSGCGSPATRHAAETALAAGGQVVSIVPDDDLAKPDHPCTVLVPCGMGAARNLLMALTGDAALVIGGRAGTKSEVNLAWMHGRPLLPLTGTGGWSDGLADDPPDDRASASILPWDSVDALVGRFGELGFV